MNIIIFFFSSPLDIKASLARIVGAIIFNSATALKVTTGIAAAGLTYDQTQAMFGVSDNNKWRIIRQVALLAEKLNISDETIIKNNVVISKEEYDKLMQNSERLKALKESQNKSTFIPKNVSGSITSKLSFIWQKERIITNRLLLSFFLFALYLYYPLI